MASTEKKQGSSSGKGEKSASSSSPSKSTSSGKQGGSHEQHVKAGQQSHKTSK
ncbi:hypothetical protein ACVJBD_000488 [Rhizobium mongolense]